MLIFLGSSFDERFLNDIIGLADDLNYMTGPHCLAVAFVPAPSHNSPNYSEHTREYLRSPQGT